MHIIIRLLIFFIKKCKLVGFLLILMCIECIYLLWYTNDELYSVKSKEQYATIEVEFTGKNVNADGEVGYCFDVKVINTGNKEVEALVGYRGQNDSNLKYDYVSEYRDMEMTDSWRNELMKRKTIPPGTEVTLQYFITGQQLNKMTGEHLIFKDGVGNNFTYLLIDDLKNTGKGGK